MRYAIRAVALAAVVVALGASNDARAQEKGKPAPRSSPG